jgi:hypothetical protein
MGVMAYSGIEQIERGEFVLTQGIMPSVATLEILPQDPSTIPQDGFLSLAYGSDKPITFYGCRVDKATFQYSQQGLVWRLNILDRRWRWRFAGTGGPVSGWFNQRFGSIQPSPTLAGGPGGYQLGSINPNSILTPQQIAAVLLDAMGEQNYDVRQLPNNSLPEMVWEADYPAQILQDLCDKLGCRICLNLDNTVTIAQTGLGAVLPADDIEQLSQVVDPPELPDSIAVVGGRTRHECQLALCPVGLDVDGTVRDIWNLSYAPTKFLKGAAPSVANVGGWYQICNTDSTMGFGEIAGWEVTGWGGVIPPGTPPNLAALWQIGGLSPAVNPRHLARQTVWRWYRIAMSPLQNQYAGGPALPPVIPGWSGERIKALWQILPIEDVMVRGWYDETQQFRPYPATVNGRYNWWTFGGNLNGTGDGTQDQYGNFGPLYYPVVIPYSIDRERGIVMFEEPMYLTDSNGYHWPADIYLTCTVSPREFVSQAPSRYVLKLSGSGRFQATGSRILRRDELVLNCVGYYDNKNNVIGSFDNSEALNAEAGYAMEAALLEYQTTNPVDATYIGLLPIGCDGAIWQVGWSVGPDGATTHVGRNTEVHRGIPSYRERVLMSSLGRTTQQTRALQDQARKS